jgi:hypothetical protein
MGSLDRTVSFYYGFWTTPESSQMVDAHSGRMFGGFVSGLAFA